MFLSFVGDSGAAPVLEGAAGPVWPNIPARTQLQPQDLLRGQAAAAEQDWHTGATGAIPDAPTHAQWSEARVQPPRSHRVLWWVSVTGLCLIN